MLLLLVVWLYCTLRGILSFVCMGTTLMTNIYMARDFARLKIEQAYPIILKWLTHIGIFFFETVKLLGCIMLFLLIVWVECTLRGISSFVRIETTAVFSVIWCSIFSVIAMVGMLKLLMVLAIAALAVVFLRLPLAMVLGIFEIGLLWFYGSFWTTMLVNFLGGLAIKLSHVRLALLITSVYFGYCAWVYVGWLGLLFALSLSFISSDALMFFRKLMEDFLKRTAGKEGVPSTSGADSDITSEDEVARLLSCTDHYSALGFLQYENVDIAILKREYKKKAMLVHPDKNRGNEKAAEAFKKLQNAYEVLLDSSKRNLYDDKLMFEELLNCSLRF